jgi:ribosome biogenesis GTPase A
MSPKVDFATQNNKIIQSIRKLYADPDMQSQGLLTHLQTVKSLGASNPELDRVLQPPERITVLLIGNHSAGKSSFVNWYVGEEILKAGVSVTTTGLQFVRRGKHSTVLLGEQTLETFPFLRHVPDAESLSKYMTTHISPSNERLFPVVDFVDTPGLIFRTDVVYPFAVDDVIVSLADYADIILGHTPPPRSRRSLF